MAKTKKEEAGAGKGKGKGKSRANCKRPASAKAKAKASAKSKAKAKAKAAAKKKAVADGKGVGKGQGNSGKGRGKGRRNPEVWIDIDKIMQPVEIPKPPVDAEPASGSTRKPRATAPAAHHGRKKRERKAQGKGEEKDQGEDQEVPEKGEPEKKKSRAHLKPSVNHTEFVNHLLSSGRIPHTFGGRAIPQKGWGLEKYCRVADTFASQVEPTLERGMKNKAQAPCPKHTCLVINP